MARRKMDPKKKRKVRLRKLSEYMVRMGYVGDFVIDRSEDHPDRMSLESTIPLGEKRHWIRAAYKHEGEWMIWHVDPEWYKGGKDMGWFKRSR